MCISLVAKSGIVVPRYEITDCGHRLLVTKSINISSLNEVISVGCQLLCVIQQDTG